MHPTSISSPMKLPGSMHLILLSIVAYRVHEALPDRGLSYAVSRTSRVASVCLSGAWPSCLPRYYPPYARGMAYALSEDVVLPLGTALYEGHIDPFPYREDVSVGLYILELARSGRAACSKVQPPALNERGFSKPTVVIGHARYAWFHTSARTQCPWSLADKTAECLLKSTRRQPCSPSGKIQSLLAPASPRTSRSIVLGPRAAIPCW